MREAEEIEETFAIILRAVEVALLQAFGRIELSSVVRDGHIDLI